LAKEKVPEMIIFCQVGCTRTHQKMR